MAEIVSRDDDTCDFFELHLRLHCVTSHWRHDELAYRARWGHVETEWAGKCLSSTSRQVVANFCKCMFCPIQADWDAENEESDTFTDTRLLPAPTETEALFTHNVSVCPSNEGTVHVQKIEVKMLEAVLCKPHRVTQVSNVKVHLLKCHTHGETSLYLSHSRDKMCTFLRLKHRILDSTCELTWLTCE